MYTNNKFIEERYNRKKNLSHWGLAVQKIKMNPILFVLFMPIVVITMGIWIKMDYLISLISVPAIILPTYVILIKIFGVIVPLILVWAIIDAIGSVTASKDEQSIMMAFDMKELRNGSPILMYKSKDKVRGHITRVWYSPIPLGTWVERQNEIEHQMKETIIKEIEYDKRAKDNRIVLISVKGMNRVKEDNLILDNELEKDLEKC